jgi:integrase
MFDLAPVSVSHNPISHEGYVFELNNKIWKLSRQHKLNLKWVDQILATDLAHSFLKVLEHYAKKYSASHTNNQCLRFQHFALERYQKRGQCLSNVSAEALIGYRATLNREHEYYLGALRGFLRSWLDLGYSGIDENVPNLLNNWRIRGNVKGRAVQTLCPEEGPLSDLEYEALHQKLINEFEKGAINIENLALVQIFMATGRRPAQLADLKVKDFIHVQSQDGLQEYLLNVPRRKLRGVHWREQFKPFALSKDIGNLLSNLIEQNRTRLFALYNISSLPDFDELPLFPKWSIIRTAANGTFKHIELDFKGPEAHHTAHAFKARVDAIVSGLEIPSERIGKRLRVFPTRLRRTIATRAAREGFGELIIAELLDHTDTQNARIYTENVPEHVDAINEAVARQLAPLAQAFAGVVIEKESDAVRGNDPTSRVRSENGNVGICGHYGFCGALAPIACYTCRNFQPWVDGPHKEVLNSLIAERERILEITQDKMMAAINDRTILAVTQVVQICERRRAEPNGESSHG